MERWVCTRRTVHGDPDAVRRRLTSGIRTLLQQASGSEVTPPTGDGSFRLELRTPGGLLSQIVEVHVGPAESLTHWTQIPLRWTPKGVKAPLVPSFDGWVELEDADSRTASLAVLGRYHPPFPLIGPAVDAIALGQIAEDTIAQLTGGLVHLLETQVEPGETARTTAMSVADVMTADPVTLPETASLRTAADLLLTRGFGGIPVVDGRGRVSGVLSERDLLDKVAPVQVGLTRQVERSWRHHDAVTVGEAASRPARTTDLAAGLRDAAAEMARHGVGRLVVLRGADVVGIITRKDVLRALIRADEAIDRAVRQGLADRGLAEVSVDVADGVVTLTGSVRLRSEVAGVVEQAAAVDGVLDVHAEALSFDTDDVVAYPIM